MEYSESFLCLNRIFPLAEDPTHYLVSLLGFVYKRQTNLYVIREIIKKKKRNHFVTKPFRVIPTQHESLFNKTLTSLLISAQWSRMARKDQLQPPQQTTLSRPCPKVIDQEGRHMISFFDDATQSFL